MEKQLEFDFKLPKEKIHVETLVDKAWDWWCNLYNYEQEKIIVAEYMKEKGLKENDVDW